MNGWAWARRTEEKRLKGVLAPQLIFKRKVRRNLSDSKRGCSNSIVTRPNRRTLRLTETEESPFRVERGSPFHRIAYCASGHDRDGRVVFEHVRARRNLLDSLLEEGNVVLAENVAQGLGAGLNADVET